MSGCYYIRLLLYPTTVLYPIVIISDYYYILLLYIRLFLYPIVFISDKCFISDMHLIYPTLTAYVRTPFLSMRVFLLPKLSHADFLGVVLKIFFTIKNFPACFKLSFALVNSVINLKTLFVNLVFTCFFNLKFFFFLNLYDQQHEIQYDNFDQYQNQTTQHIIERDSS
jgi:hypothetical protein